MMAKISEGLEFRWLRPDDRLLRKVASWSKAVAFSDYPAERHALMLKGYFRAGHVLVDQCHKNPHEGHTMIYPILYCYRHALEIAMQWIVTRYGQHFSVSLPEADHNLWHLWGSCKAMFDQIDNEDAAVGTSIVEKLIKEFHDLDTNAQAFRYAVRKDGTLIHLPNVAVDPADIRDVVEGIENFFSGADGYLDELCSASEY
jgi:hypothetical protein